MTRVLLVRLSAMGDLVQSLGAVRSLRVAAPDWTVGLVTQGEFAPLLRGVEGIDRTFCFERRGGLRAVMALRRELRAFAADVAVDLQGNWKSAMVTRLAGAADSLGMGGAARQEPRSRWLLRRTIEGRGVHHPARAAWELVRSLCPQAPFFRPRLVAGDGECDRERAELAALGVDADRPFCVVVGSSPTDPRGLAPQFVVDLLGMGIPAVVLLGPAEGEALVPPGAAVLRHRRGELRRLVGLGGLVARSGGEVWGPDQGATHVLLAAGAPGMVVFGSQDPRRTAPPASRPLRNAAPPSCSPCLRRRCDHPDGPVCMRFRPTEGLPSDVGLPPEGAVGAGPW